jgi:hypothetical protein
MTNFSKLDKAQKYYVRVKELDSEIISLDKLAMSIATTGGEIKINIENPSQQEAPSYLEQESLLYPDTLSSKLFIRMSRGCDSPQVDQLRLTLTDTTALEALGAIIGAKRSERQALIEMINNLMK